MDIVYDGKFCYRSPSKALAGWCHLQVLQGKTHCLLLATELPDNPGLPIKNSVIHILKQAISFFNLDLEKLHYILHAPATSGSIEYCYVPIKVREQPDFKYLGPPDQAPEFLIEISYMNLDQVNAILETF